MQRKTILSYVSIFTMLFVFLMPVTSYAAINLEGESWGDVQLVAADRDWHVVFNRAANVGEDGIFVIDENGLDYPVELDLLNNNQEVLVRPQNDYKPGQTYYLQITTNVTDQDGEALSQAVWLQFIIKEECQDVTLSSSVYTVNNSEATINTVPAGTDVEVFKGNLSTAEGASFEVYGPGGEVVENSCMLSGDEVRVTAADGATKTYIVTLDEGTNDGTYGTVVTTSLGHYNITVHATRLIPAYNPITANATPITTAVKVETFINNINLPAGSKSKLVNASTIPGSFATWEFDNITDKQPEEYLEIDDLLLVEGADGTLRGYHITVTD